MTIDKNRLVKNVFFTGYRQAEDIITLETRLCDLPHKSVLIGAYNRECLVQRKSVPMRYPFLLSLACVLLYACFGGDDNNPITTPAVGLNTRPGNTTCLAVNHSQNSSVLLTRIFPNMSFTRPIFMLQAPNNTNRWYIAEQRGRILWIDANDNAGSTQNIVLDMATANISIRSYANANCNECGLLGLAFDPDFANNGYMYLSFTAPETDPNTSETMQSFISRFTSSDGGLTLDPNSRVDIFNLLQPFRNHNGGHIMIGPDALLYLGLGDGGSGNDPLQHGQSITSLHGSILRLNTDGTAAPGNVVAGQGGRAEIYAYGLRNPWRFSFDRQTGDLWLGDVGQGQYEEVNRISNGGNYGWRCREGLHATANSCSTNGPFIDPVSEYDHTEGISITGGYVYRGTAIPGLAGVYIFADYGSGTIWGLFPQVGNQYTRQTLIDSGLSIASFAEDSGGEIYLMAFDGGLYRIDQDNNNSNASGPAANLADTGCVNPNDPTQVASGLIPYDLNEPFWSDGAEKQRYMALPDNTTISINDEGDFLFPVGTVLVKTFRLNGRLIETRLFMHEAVDVWRGYSYQWNNAQTSATLLDNATDVVIDNQTWHFPSRTECLQCHTSAAQFSLGPEVRQLNRNFTYPSTGTTANQLDTLQHIGLLSGDIPSIDNNPLISSSDTNASTEQRARSYLHSNCSNCHRPNGTSQGTMDLQIDTAFADTRLCNITPQNGDLGIAGAALIAPREPDLSILLARINRSDEHRMPPTSSNVVDNTGVSLIREWIEGIATCP